MEDYKNLIWWLRWMGQGQPGSATYTRVADAFENLLTENATLQEAYDAMSRDLAARTEQVRRLQEEKAKLCYGQEDGKADCRQRCTLPPRGVITPGTAVPERRKHEQTD